MISLFYRAWANAQPTVNRDRPESDRFARYVGAFVGQCTRVTAAAPSELDELALYAATHFISPTRHAEGLCKVLRLCFGVPVEVEEFVGTWLEIPAEYCWHIPSSLPHAQSPIGVLGVSARVGTQIWDRQSKFRIIIGPVPLDEYQRFLPGGDYLPRLIDLVHRYAGVETRWDASLILREAERRGAILGVIGSIGQTANLGQSDGKASSFESFQIDPMDHLPRGASHA